MTEFFFALVVLILKEWCKREEISEVGQAVLARATAESGSTFSERVVICQGIKRE